jgi:hypothetical protein
MLDEMIGEIIHKSTGTRVISNSIGDIAVEESFRGSGNILGVEVTDIRSVSIVGLQGEGTGVMMTREGEMATYTRHGIGWANERGVHTVRAALLFKTTSKRLERLNKIIVVTELEEEEEGTHEKLWEWK